MKAEAERLKEKESHMFSKVSSIVKPIFSAFLLFNALSLRVHPCVLKVSDDVLGKNAETVFRDKKTGKQRNLKAEDEQKLAKDAKIKEKYDTWGKG